MYYAEFKVKSHVFVSERAEDELSIIITVFPRNPANDRWVYSVNILCLETEFARVLFLSFSNPPAYRGEW